MARQYKEQWKQLDDAKASADQPAPEQAAAIGHVSYWNRGNRASYSFSTILVFFFVYVLLSFWLFGNTHARTPLALLGGSLLYCMHAFWGLIPLISGVDMFIRLMSGQVARRRTFLAIRHDGLLSEERDGVTLNRWSWVEPLQLQQQHVYVYVTRNEPLHVIPLRDFGGRAAAEQFVQAANQLRLTSLADHEDHSPGPPVIAQETGNPYQPPQT